MATKYKVFILVFVAAVVLTSVQVEAQGADLLVNGEEVDVNLRIVNGRTMVPLDFVNDYFGAEVEWEAGSSEGKVIHPHKVIELEIGNKIALVNSEPVPLGENVRSIDGQVMLPLRFLTGIYGGNLAWQESSKSIYYQTNQLKGVEVKDEEDTFKLIIDSNFISNYDLQLYHQPTRLVLDMHDVSFKELQETINVGSESVNRVRFSQFDFAPAIARIVVDIGNMSSYNIKEDGSNLILEVEAKEEVITSSIISTNHDLINQLRLTNKRVVIDPGHGGTDSGAIGVTGLKEKEVALDIATRVDDLLYQAGINTLMTRRDDSFISLAQRAEIANRFDADLFVSIHSNASYNSWANGLETYAHWDASQDNWALAWYVQDEILQRTDFTDHGLKAANFAVLRRTNLPAILVEAGFLSNPADEELLRSSQFRQQIAEGVVAGIKRYFAEQS
ncbi:N-acetylmuramoyl-L-alanine amidase family protein [Natroniella sulfidigena]|uniref:N-acetylmuramoyl-L-alanine amidase n=1 Tax=Natroniella sulfidigena TaxID=723921 RepID=UPI002009EAA1|nr:N-acetylmuramoyl-L-alanine amidase family protein [Natroniella sulfidigena]